MKFINRARRRRAGIYLFRTDRHFGGGRENGYVGRSNYVDLREECHRGICGRHPGCLEKSWMDLRPRRYTLWLPWWLSWKWTQAVLEVLAVAVLLPRYNVQLNGKNPRRVPLRVQAMQRAARQANRRGYWAVKTVTAGLRRTLQFAGAAFILIGIIGTVWSNVA